MEGLDFCWLLALKEHLQKANVVGGLFARKAGSGLNRPTHSEVTGTARNGMSAQNRLAIFDKSSRCKTLANDEEKAPSSRSGDLKECVKAREVFIDRLRACVSALHFDNELRMCSEVAFSANGLCSGCAQNQIRASQCADTLNG